MKNLFFFILYYIIKHIKNRDIYQCSRYGGLTDQCLNKWVDPYGNTRIDLWRCPTNKYCQTLIRKDDNINSIGICTYNYKKLYDRDFCSYNSECSSLYCTGGRCEGIYEGGLCSPGYFQCMNNLVCRKVNEIYPYGEYKEIYKCTNLSQINETCINDNECDLRLVCDNDNLSDIINNLTFSNITELNNLSNYISFEEYMSIKLDNKKKCIQRASLENGLPTENPMSCKSGDTINVEIFPNYSEQFCVSKKEIIQDCDEENNCIIKVNLGKFGETEIKQNCVYTVKGNPLCPLEQKETAWKNYLSKFEEYYKLARIEKNRVSLIHIPVYKNTFNIFEVSQSFWYYTDWLYNIESDTCTKEYFFLKNKSNIFNFSIFYYLYIIIYIIISL